MKDPPEGLCDLAVIFPDDASTRVVASLEQIVHIRPLMGAPEEEGPDAKGIFRYLIARLAPAIFQRPGQLVSIAAIAGGHVCTAGHHAWSRCWQWIAFQADEVKLVLARYVIGPFADIRKVNHACWQLIHVGIIPRDAQVTGALVGKCYGEAPGLRCEIRWSKETRSDGH